MANENELRPLGKLVAEKIGKRMSPAALWRWHKTGLANGARLQVQRVGGALFCRDSWWDEFLRAQQSPQSRAVAAALPNPCEDELRAAGLLVAK
jgi:hypothetical protein